MTIPQKMVNMLGGATLAKMLGRLAVFAFVARSEAHRENARRLQEATFRKFRHAQDLTSMALEIRDEASTLAAQAGVAIKKSDARLDHALTVEKLIESIT